MFSPLIQYSEVKAQLDQERTQVSQLVEQIAGLQMEIKGIKEDHLNKEEALNRENTVLRDQLKKYVSLVQAQRKETMKQPSFDGLFINLYCVCTCMRACRCVMAFCTFPSLWSSIKC